MSLEANRGFQHIAIFSCFFLFLIINKKKNAEAKSLFLLASAKSNGALFVSAIDPIKNIIKTGNKGTMNHIAL